MRKLILNILSPLILLDLLTYLAFGVEFIPDRFVEWLMPKDKL